MASVRINVHNPAATTARLKRIFESNALPVVAEQILTDCNTYVRMQTGNLAASGHTEAGGKRIVWNTGYAKRVYYTGTPQKNVNPNASLRWCEKAKRNHSKDWAAMASRLTGGG